MFESASTGNRTPGRFAWRWAAALLVVLAAWPACTVRAAEAETAEETPTAEPMSPEAAARVEKTRQLLFDYLTKNYGRQLESKDWITRSVAVISLAKLSTKKVTAVLFERLEKEEHPVARVVVWQAMLARAPMLDPEQFKRWEELTWQMVRKDLFHGDLRIGLLEMLSSAPLTPEGKAWFSRLFSKSSSLDSADIPTLIAMGRAVRSWGNADLVTGLIGQMRSPDTAIRAELVLQAAGANVKWNRTPKAFAAYTEWWEKAKESFTANPPDDKTYQKLIPQFVAAPVPAEQIDPRDENWRKDLELGDLGLRMFDFAISIDCSRSMAGELERLKRDMRIMFEAFTQVSHEPRVSITCFAPGGEVEHLPLTGERNRLMAAVGKVKIFGPVGDEEWAGSLVKAITGSEWVPVDERNKRVIVLISDEPIADKQDQQCLKIAKEAGGHGYRIYGVKIFSGKGQLNPLATEFDRTATVPAQVAASGPWAKNGKGWAVYDKIAELTDAKAIGVKVPQGAFGLGGPPEGNQSPVAIAPIYKGGGPTSQILTMVLTDAINPQYSDRVEPLVKMLVAYCQKEADRPAERRKWGAPNTMKDNLKQ